MNSRNELFHVPKTLLEKLSCTKCKKYLSVSPIYILPDNKGYACGRCGKDDESLQKNVAYEDLISFLYFPCINHSKGCSFSGTGEEMISHENICQYRQLICPAINTKCNWTGPIDDLLEHFVDFHANLLMEDNSFELNFIHDYNDISLMQHGYNLILVRKIGNIEKRTFWCSVRCLTESEEHIYHLSFHNSGNGSTITSGRKNALSLSDDDGIEMSFDQINFALSDPLNVIVRVKMETPAQNMEHKEKLDERKLEMLRVLECPICLLYMVPPIYQCQGGHSICSNCKNSITTCPTCKREFGDTQNFTVESLTSFLQYPCKNYESGCEQLLSAKDIRQHEEYCEYSAIDCPTKAYSDCKWTGGKNIMLRHCKIMHPDNVVEMPTINIPINEEFDEDDEDCFIIKLLGNIFMIHFKFSHLTKEFFWEVQLFGPKDQSKNFLFEIDINDANGNFLQICAKKFCGSFGTPENSFKNPSQCLILPLSQVKPLLSHILSFRVDVFKN